MNNTETEGFAPTYFPGTPNMSEATRVTVKAGQEMTGANFALIVARMARVRGRAINSRGEPVSQRHDDDDARRSAWAFGMNMINAMVAGDGTFQFANVPPGRYNLKVRPQGMPTRHSEIAVDAVTVGNDDIET